jgi:hypothetical protein
VEALGLGGGALVLSGGCPFHMRSRLNSMLTGLPGGPGSSCVRAACGCGGLLPPLLGKLVLVVQFGEEASLPGHRNSSHGCNPM